MIHIIWIISSWKMIRIAQSSTMWWHPCSIHSSSTSWISSWSHSHFRRVKHLVNFHCWNYFDICHELCHRCSSIGWQVQSSIDTLCDRNDCIPGCFSWMACWCWLHESCKSFCPSCGCFWWVPNGLTWVSPFLFRMECTLDLVVWWNRWCLPCSCHWAHGFCSHLHQLWKWFKQSHLVVENLSFVQGSQQKSQ